MGMTIAEKILAAKSGNLPALRALLAEGGRLPYRLDAADLGRFSRLDLSGYAAVIVDSPRGFPPGAAAALARYAEEGRDSLAIEFSAIVAGESVMSVGVRFAVRAKSLLKEVPPAA